jgi:hypothetical protein
MYWHLTRKGIEVGAAGVVALCCVAACSTAASSSSPQSGGTSTAAAADGNTPTASASSPTASPSTAAGPEVVVCNSPTSGNQVGITTVNVATGKYQNSTFTYQSENFDTSYGQVTWNPTDDSGIEEGNGDPCQGWEWNPTYTSIIGLASITNGNTVPASVSIAGNTLTFLAPVHQSTGFKASPSANILDAVFGPDNQAWWLTQASGSSTAVVLHHDGQAQTITFPRDVDVTNGVTIGFGASGAWILQAMANDDASMPVWATAKGISDASNSPLPPLTLDTIGQARLSKLLPQTNYNLYGGLYSTDRSEIAFLANLSGQDYQLFTVPASGGNPTQITSGSVFPGVDEELVYFGPSVS